MNSAIEEIWYSLEWALFYKIEERERYFEFLFVEDFFRRQQPRDFQFANPAENHL